MTTAIASHPLPCVAPAPADGTDAPRASTFVVFSGELDKLLMAFTLANASAASGMATTMFFAFWSIAALRRDRRARGKNLIERMFGWMLPRNSKALPLSTMNCGGLGPPLIRWRMKRRGVASLEEQMHMAQQLGVRFVVCEASLDLMGFRTEELVPGVEIGGAAQCLADAARSDVAMVI